MIIRYKAPLILLLFSPLISSCQLYKNNGRNMFESAAPGHVNTNVALELNCWQQPRTESLWFPSENSNLSVHTIDDKTIEVCLENDK